jgi:hypothetical protein
MTVRGITASAGSGKTTRLAQVLDPAIVRDYRDLGGPCGPEPAR